MRRGYVWPCPCQQGETIYIYIYSWRTKGERRHLVRSQCVCMSPGILVRRFPGADYSLLAESIHYTVWEGVKTTRKRPQQTEPRSAVAGSPWNLTSHTRTNSGNRDLLKQGAFSDELYSNNTYRILKTMRFIRNCVLTQVGVKRRGGGGGMGVGGGGGGRERESICCPPMTITTKKTVPHKLVKIRSTLNYM